MKSVDRRLAGLVLAACGLVGSSGAAAQASPYYIGASQAFTRENNIFRVAEGQTETSDTYSTTSLLAGINQPIGRQRLFADAAARYNRYSDNTQLDHTGFSLDAGLDWETIETLSGRLGYTIKEGLARYGADLGPVLTTRNLERTQEFLARGQYGMASLLSLEASFVHRQLDYSAPQYAFQEFRQDAVRAGLLYRPSGLLTLGIAGRRTEGRYPSAVELFPGVFRADDFRRNDLDFTAMWVPTGLSTLRLRLSYTNERHDVVISRDVAQTTGALSWEYKPTAKLWFMTEAIRDTGAESAFSRLAQASAGTVGNYSQLSSTLMVRSIYDVTAKIQFDLSGRYVERDLVNTQSVAAPATGSDKFGEAKFGVTWAPTRSLRFGCSIGREKRGTSSPLSFPYSTRIAACLGQFKLE